MTRGPDIEKGELSQMKRMIEIDDNIELVLEDLKTYAKQARESIQSLKAEKKRVREELNQMPLFGNQEPGA